MKRTRISFQSLFLLAFVLSNSHLHAQAFPHDVVDRCEGCCLTTETAYNNRTSRPDRNQFKSIMTMPNQRILTSKNGEYALSWKQNGIELKILNTGRVLWSANVSSSVSGVRYLIMQDDGNVVIYDGPTALWSTDTYNHPEQDGNPQCNYLVLQDDGNLVQYDYDVMSSDDVIWSTGTYKGTSLNP